MTSPFMRCAHGTPRGVRMPFSNESSAAAAFVQPTFLLQLKKVGKKRPFENKWGRSQFK
jgi:hypothetical protein